MRSLIIFVCLLALTACADDAVDRARLVDTTDAVADVSTNVDASEGDALADAVEIIEADVVDEPDVAADTNTDTCTCSTVGPCCDGCEAISPGAACDDGLSCTLGTTCQLDGQCGGATASPCDELLNSPACQAATCDEVAGCSVRSAHEGFACDDGDERTLDDRCDSGQCIGTPCEYDEGACCDGCNFLPADTVCEAGEEREWCSAFETCGASRVRQEEQRRCSGDSGACEAPAQWVTVEVIEDCFGGDYCTRRNGAAQCYPEFGC